MKIKNFLCELIVSLLVILSLSFAANAAQQAAGAKSLTTNIKISQNLVKPVMPPAVSNDEYKALLKEVQQTLVQWDYIDGSAKWQQKQCAEKSYTVEEQKAAGCLGTDTVDACSQKLYHHCMQTGMHHNTYMDRLNSMKQAVDKLMTKSTQYRKWLNDAEKQYQ